MAKDREVEVEKLRVGMRIRERDGVRRQGRRKGRE